MSKILRLSFSLKNTYRVNSIIYSLKQIPLIKKLIPGKAYQSRGLKIFANVLFWIWEVLSAFLGKLLYFLFMFALPLGWYKLQGDAEPSAFLHLLIMLSAIGAFANTYMFNPTKDKYYAMILLGIDAKGYTLVNYFYEIVRLLLGFSVFGIIFGRSAGLNMWECILIPLFVAGVKLIYAAAELRLYEMNKKVTSENSLGVVRWALMGVLLLVGYGLPALGLMLPRTVSVGVMCVVIFAGILSLGKIFTFSGYHAMYKEILFGAMVFLDPNVQKDIQRKHDQKNISVDADIFSNKKGFEYLNELFVKRHRKILWKSAKRIALVAAIIFAGLVVLVMAMPEEKAEVNELVMTFLPYFVFIMYVMNRGTGFTRALFVNCDHSLLTYSFYKQPKMILKLFRIRLWEIIKVNLLPAGVVGGGLALLLFASGGTDNPFNYVIIIVSVVCMSIFFSVHYLTLYYMLQPYNAGTEMKSGTYQLIMMATYVVCYAMIYLRLPTFVFGLCTIVFCILYSVAACLLVYKVAPKTFRIRS
ncbi:MAG: hypothetical protein IJ427_08035 [Lachnospiraceae bacterium]|nr:hypothetical protein [Lachnospiraceae bacterium]MBQ8548434.1 hypothetical protein [Lachnospiraceae bacterium]